MAAAGFTTYTVWLRLSRRMSYFSIDAPRVLCCAVPSVWSGENVRGWGGEGWWMVQESRAFPAAAFRIETKEAGVQVNTCSRRGVG